jgi:adenine-specific DNA methylase
LEITKKALDFECKTNAKIELKLNDTRSLKFLENESIDFILTHPPYSDIIKYSE